MFKILSLIVVLAIGSIGCQVSHPPMFMVNPMTGEKVTITHHGTTGKLSSALAARWATEADVEAYKARGFVEQK